MINKNNISTGSSLMAKAYIMMNCDLGEEKEVIQSLQEIVGIKEAHGTLGLYDIVAQIECTTDEKIQEIVKDGKTFFWSGKYDYNLKDTNIQH